MDIAYKAQVFAIAAHAAIDQRRKYTNEPYIVHPMEVAAIVGSVPHTQEMLAAAWLHDVVEDTAVTLDLIHQTFGEAVAELVNTLTDAFVDPAFGNRAARKKMERDRIAHASDDAKTIKLADLISNTSTITRYDPGFAKVYMAEKQLLLIALRGGDATLHRRATEQVDRYFASA